MESLFVGRENELSLLQEYLRQASLGKGLVAFLQGDAGIGKSLFIEEIQQRVVASERANDILFLTGYCYRDTGPNSAYQPFIEILNSLPSQKEKDRGFWSLLTKVMKETAPDWLEAVPVIGPLLGASAKTVTVASDLLVVESTQDKKLESMISQYIDALSTLANKNYLLVCVIEDAHWIDNASCQLLERLAEFLSSNSILVVVTYRNTELMPNHPLYQARAEILSKNQGKQIELSGLNSDQIAQYLERRYDTNLNEKMPDWLHHICNGHPLFVSQYCNLLEQEKVISESSGNFLLDGVILESDGQLVTDGLLSRIPIPVGIEALLEQRISRLLDEEKLLLELASVQGELFGSNVLALLTDKRETDVLTRLRKVAERHRVIRLLRNDLVQDLHSEFYEFEHVLMHNAFYKKLSPREQLLYHREIARILVEQTKDDETSRKRLLEIAHHYSLGKQPIKSAKYSYSAAQSSFNDGALVECRNLCEQALLNIQMEPSDNGERDRLFAQTALLLMTSIWPRSKTEKLQILALGNQAAIAAKNANDNITFSGIKTRIGSLYIGLGNVPEALKHSKEGYEAAQASGDVVAICNAMELYGREVSKVDLEQGLTIRRAAYKIYIEQIIPNKLQTTNIDFTISKLLVSLGVGEFDAGSYSAALDYLNEGINIIRTLNFQRTTDLMTPALNYLAQVLIALGLFSEAEKVLIEAIEPFQSDKPDPWNGNNHGLLGKLYIEWGKVEDAVHPLRDGIQESELTQQIDLITLVRNYFGELLMHPHFSGHDLQKAKEVLTTNLGECQLSGMHRSTVVALSLLSRLALQQGVVADATNYSAQAIGLLDEYGELPAVRSEEIYFYHYLALKESGELEFADTYLERAYNVLQRKATGIKNKDHRLSFFNNVHLSRNILTHYMATNVIS